MQKDILNDKDAMGKSGIADAAIRIKKKIEDSIKKGERKEQKRVQAVVRQTNDFNHDDDDDDDMSADEKKSVVEDEDDVPGGRKKIGKGNFLD